MPRNEVKSTTKSFALTVEEVGRLCAAAKKSNTGSFSAWARKVLLDEADRINDREARFE